MALPMLRSLPDCANFTLTVQPFLPQLVVLPRLVLDNLKSPSGLLELYIATNPLISAFAVSLLLAGIFLIVSEANQNVSQVDRMWSILPNLYIVHLVVWARLAGVSHSRVDLIAIFSTIWSCRLTFNYWRRGGYQIGSEDYRWQIIKGRLPAEVWSVFNLIVISLFQSVLLFLFSCVPAYAILLSSQFEEEIRTPDIVFLVTELTLVLIEWFSDGQQWNYQTAKHQYQKDAKLPKGYRQSELDRGFLASGIWGYSRHPNFFAEQTIWLVLYQWACYSTNTFFTWTVTGSGLLIFLFQGSTRITEAITAGKYPEYAEYQKQVGTFIPISFRPYETPVSVPKIIKTSDLAKREEKKQEEK